MKRSLLSIICTLLVFVTGFSQEKPVQSVKKSSDKVDSNTPLTQKQVEELRKKHAYHLANNKVNAKFNLPKAQRKAEGLPPNKANEQEWLLSMNPTIGRPTPENLDVIRQDLEKLRKEALEGRIPGDAVGNEWVERGPNNVGGRTRAIIYNTVAGANAVVAGGVSGGLWKNADITTTGAWTRVTTFPEHINVQNITVDPNDASTWYVGTGESYVAGDVNGNGIWKTTDAGTTWSRVFGGGTVSTSQSAVYNLQIVSPSNAGVVRGYISVQAAFGPGITDPLENYPIVWMNDGSTAIVTGPSGTNDDGCQSTPQDLTGKIALIRRGNCNFTAKVQAAELRGAVGVIVMNNGPAGAADPIIMGGTDPGITIPSLMISGADGNLLLANLTGLTGSFIPTNVGEFTGDSVANVHFINDIAIKDMGTTSEIYAAIGDGYYGDASTSTYFSATTYGLYKSTNGGSTWTKLTTLPVAPSGNVTCPNDIEISANGDIWVSSTDSWTFGDGGGKVYRSQNNGTSFAQMHSVNATATTGAGARVEIEAAPSDQNTMYILSELSQIDTNAPKTEVQLLRSVNATAATPTFTAMALPTGNETRETTYGFTGAQAFYDMMIECDPTNPEILYVGGIDLYRTANAKTGATVTWTAISDWTLNVHSDQHALTFKPGSPNVGLFGNDGGVYYGSSLSTAGNAVARNNGFNVTQFVGLAVKPLGGGTTGDFFLAGAQDNGSNYFPSNLNTTTGSAAGINGSNEIQGGDGGKPLFKQNATTVNTSYYVANYVYNDDINTYSLNGSLIKSLRGTNPATQGASDLGLFYPAMALDSTNDIVYSDAVNSDTPTYQICRYTSIIGGGNATRTYLTNATNLNTYPTVLSVGKATPTTLYAGLMNGKVLKITSASSVAATVPDANVTNIAGSGFVGSVSDIEFGANDSEIFVTMHNYGVNNIWYTRNGGTNWYRLDGNLPDMPVKAFLQNPLNTAQIMIGTELGVWYADTFNPATNADQALVWKQAFNGMSNVKVTDLDIQPNSPTAPTAYNVFAATYGRGVFSGALTNTLANNQNEIANNSIKVYPTVSKGNVTIASEKVYGKTNVELFDITGKKVYANTISINSDAQQVNFGTLSAGNYVLKLKGEGFEGTQKLIIN
ncbi:MAG: PA domain-containing protein [Bacteroidota bacterium]